MFLGITPHRVRRGEVMEVVVALRVSAADALGLDVCVCAREAAAGVARGSCCPAAVAVAARAEDVGQEARDEGADARE